MPSKETNGNGKSKNGGIMARIGYKFHDDMEEITKERLKRPDSKKPIGTSKITNLITRHNLWKRIKADIINAKEEEVNQYG